MPASPIPDAPAARPAAVCHGVALTFETLGPAPGELRRSPSQDTLIRVIDGRVSLTLSDERLLLEPAGEAIIPAGIGHRLQALYGEARVVMGFRPSR